MINKKDNPIIVELISSVIYFFILLIVPILAVNLVGAAAFLTLDGFMVFTDWNPGARALTVVWAIICLVITLYSIKKTYKK